MNCCLICCSVHCTETHRRLKLGWLELPEPSETLWDLIPARLLETTVVLLGVLVLEDFMTLIVGKIGRKYCMALKD